jgi:hypothetical protein
MAINLLTNGGIMLKRMLIPIIFFFLNCNIFAQEGNNVNNSPIIYRSVSLSANNGMGYLSIINALTLKEIKKIFFNEPGYIVQAATKEQKVFIVNFGGSLSTNGVTVVDLVRLVKVGELFPSVSVSGIKLSPDNLLWVLLPEQKQIAIVNPQTLETKNFIQAGDAPRDIVFHPTKQLAYVLSETGKIVVYDTNKLISLRGSSSIFGDTSNFKRSRELVISSSGDILYIGNKNTVTIFSTESFKPIDAVTFNNESRFNTLQLQLSKDGNKLYISELDGLNCNVYDLHNKQIKRIFRSTFGEIQNIQISPDGALLYINDFRGRAIIDTTDDSIILSETDLLFLRDSGRGIDLSGDFSIGQAPAIQTTAPVTNQQVMAGQELTIKWQTTVAPQSFSIASHKVELSTDGGTTFATIPKAENLGADVREFTWQVPTDIEILNKAQIRVSTVDLGAKRANSTTGNFSIVKPGGGQTGDTQAPMVAFLSPKGGERFTSGDNIQITWMSSDNVAVTSQDLSLSTDGGNTFPISLASGLPGTTQSFSFPTPMTLQSDQARLRLIVRDSAGNMAQSLTPSSFRIELGADTIAPVVTIAQPTANQKLIAGQAIDVKWQSTDNRQLVSQALQLSLDGGNTFATVASFGASDNSFIINNIAELAMTNAQAVVRITATDSSGNIGQASVMFSMSSAITTAVYQAKVLSIAGIGFISNASGSTTRVFVNEKEITITPTMLSNNNLTIKGSKKKLGIIRGNNTVRLLVNGVSSNTLSFSF